MPFINLAQLGYKGIMASSIEEQTLTLSYGVVLSGGGLFDDDHRNEEDPAVYGASNNVSSGAAITITFPFPVAYVLLSVYPFEPFSSYDTISDNAGDTSTVPLSGYEEGTGEAGGDSISSPRHQFP